MTAPARALEPGVVGRIAASERQTNRSAFLQEAARRELGWPDPAAIDAALQRGRDARAGAGHFESAKLIRRERDARERRRQ